MMKLTALKKKHNFSVLIVAHPPKRDMTRPITQNDLAGSKKLFNFFDSCFAIGQSARDNALRYIKQIKVRHGEFEYHSDNVIICQIEKNGAFLQLTPIGFATEREHLKEQSEKDKDALKQQAIEMRANGMSVKEISVALGVPDKTLYRWFKESKE